jgi:dephospho-CoA kinase
MIVGLTGGIGSGKSTVARVLEILGAAVFDSDAVAKELYFVPAIKSAVISLIGPGAYLSDKQLNRPFIAKAVFENASLLTALNGILHPAVYLAMQSFVSAHRGQLIVKESALLFEAGIEKQVDKIIVVCAPETLRIQRVLRRDQLSEREIRARMASQWPSSEKIKLADFIINNDEIQPLIPQVLSVYASLTSQNVS